MSIDESIATDPFGRFLIKQSNEWREIGVEAERERILNLIWDFMPNLLTDGATPRDLQAFDYVKWQFRHQLIEAIKGENK
jgi:hypothetical protein